jgi:hypothetical protein
MPELEARALPDSRRRSLLSHTHARTHPYPSWTLGPPWPTHTLEGPEPPATGATSAGRSFDDVGPLLTTHSYIGPKGWQVGGGRRDVDTRVYSYDSPVHLFSCPTAFTVQRHQFPRNARPIARKKTVPADSYLAPHPPNPPTPPPLVATSSPHVDDRRSAGLCDAPSVSTARFVWNRGSPA